jgi:putative ABC transport system ATP-binding protein
MGYALRVDAHLQPRIAVEGLTFEVSRGTEGARRIVDDVSFSVAAGGAFTVLGPSGSGKSTLLRCLNRLLEPSAGRVLLDGRDARELPVQELRRRVGMVFQTAALFDGSVLDNVLYGPRLRGDRAEHAAGDADAACTQAEGLLRRVGLPAAFCDKPVTELSGGEAQRVSLARALANEPEVLLLDEPTAALDPTARQVIEDLLVELAADTDLTFLFVTHNLAQARRIGHHGLLLVDGRVVDQGPLPAFLDDPAEDVTRQFVEGRLQSGETTP